MDNFFEQYKRKLIEDDERNRLVELQTKYKGIGTPNYANMSLRDELQTRFDLNELNELQQKYGAQQTPTSAPQTPTQPAVQQDTSNNWQNNVLNALQNIADLTEKGSLAFTNGITLGGFDEAVGIIGGTVGTAKSYLNNQDLNKGYRQGYQTVRNDIRNKYNQFSIEHPVLNTAMESFGAFTSPVKFFRYSKTTPLAIQNKLNKYNAVANGLAYGFGSGQDNWQNYARQLSIGIIGNGLG